MTLEHFSEEVDEIFIDKDLSGDFFQLMNAYREQEMLCDIILKVK